MTAPAPEPHDYVFHATTLAGLAALICLYIFGVWLRSYILPTPNDIPIRRQLLASFPVGCITIALYAKSAFPALTIASESLVFDVFVMAGYVMIFGMLSRESLERLLKIMKQKNTP